MRKFTKEIAALLASAAFSASMTTVSAFSDEPTPTAGIAIDPESITEPLATTTEPLIGTEMPGATTTTAFTTTHTIGTMTTPSTTTITETEPFMETTTTAMIGTEMYFETTTAMIGTEIPPLLGDVALPDGDANGDGNLDIADVVALEKFLTNAPDKPVEEEPEETRPITDGSDENISEEQEVKNAKMNNWYAADMFNDGKINGKDLTMLRRELLGPNR